MQVARVNCHAELVGTRWAGSGPSPGTYRACFAAVLKPFLCGIAGAVSAEAPSSPCAAAARFAIAESRGCRWTAQFHLARSKSSTGACAPSIMGIGSKRTRSWPTRYIKIAQSMQAIDAIPSELIEISCRCRRSKASSRPARLRADRDGEERDLARRRRHFRRECQERCGSFRLRYAVVLLAASPAKAGLDSARRAPPDARHHPETRSRQC